MKKTMPQRNKCINCVLYINTFIQTKVYYKIYKKKMV